MLRPTYGAVLEQLAPGPVIIAIGYAALDLSYALSYTVCWGLLTALAVLTCRVRLAPGVLTSTGRFRHRTLLARDIFDLRVGRRRRFAPRRLLGTTADGKRLALWIPLGSWLWGRGRDAQAAVIITWWETWRQAESGPLIRARASAPDNVLTFPVEIDQGRTVRPAYIGPRGLHDASEGPSV